MRIAVIDIGSNSVRCTIHEVPVGGARRTLDDEKEYTRLGRGAVATGELDASAIDATIAALGRMLQIARSHQVTHVRAVATAAVREAANAATLLERAREELDLDIEVVSAEEEARLVFLGAADAVGVRGRTAVIDIGGGSVEIVRATDRQIEFIASLPLGAVVMSERYHFRDPIPRADYRRLVRHVRRALRHALREDPDPIAAMIASGGTVVAAAALVAARRDPSLASLHGYSLRRADLAHLRASLEESSAESRAAMKAMSPNRVDTILAGVVVLDEAMRVLGANELSVNARGMREGVVVDILERERGLAAPFEPLYSVREFARKCHTDVAHSEQVRRLALELFDAIGADAGLEPEHRELLEAAALLHDVGYHIAYERHHKHSYHLISYADLPGYSAAQTRLIAAVARYHTGALPKPGHEAMHELTRPERRVVERLAALLRLADGLDRSRGQRVERLELDLTPSRLAVLVVGSGPLDAEIHGAQRKADLLERAYRVRVDVFEAIKAC